MATLKVEVVDYDVSLDKKLQPMTSKSYKNCRIDVKRLYK